MIPAGFVNSIIKARVAADSDGAYFALHCEHEKNATWASLPLSQKKEILDGAIRFANRFKSDFPEFWRE